MPARRAPVPRVRRRQRGVAMVESVLMLPFLVTLMVGVLEFGMAWRSSIAISAALRSSARTVASQGASGAADYYALQALNSGLSGVPSEAIRRIVVYNATTNPAPDPTCLTMTAPSGQTGARACNVYDASALLLSASSFSTGATGSCPASAVDRWYCPVTRNVVQSSGADAVGVYVEIRHDFASRIFGAGLTIRDKFIVRLEPI
jgi:Flp pilus assembly protein TadG